MVSSVNSTTTDTTVATKKDTTSAQAQKDQFLQILLTQLQHQNPMEPMKPEEFSTQLAQFSALEQQVDTNTKLDALIAAMSPTNYSPTTYLGKNVDYTSNIAPVQDGKAEWTYNVTGASSVKIEVKDGTGAVVYSGDGDVTAGDHKLSLSFEDTSADGAALTLTVTALDANGKALAPTITAHATITAVSTAAGNTDLEASGYTIPTSKVTRISTPSTKTTA